MVHFFQWGPLFPGPEALNKEILSAGRRCASQKVKKGAPPLRPAEKGFSWLLIQQVDDGENLGGKFEKLEVTRQEWAVLHRLDWICFCCFVRGAKWANGRIDTLTGLSVRGGHSFCKGTFFFFFFFFPKEIWGDTFHAICR